MEQINTEETPTIPLPAEIEYIEEEPEDSPAEEIILDRSIKVTGNEDEEKAAIEKQPLVVREIIDKTRGMLVGLFFQAHKEDESNKMQYKQFTFNCNRCNGFTCYYRYPRSNYPSDLLCLTTECLSKKVEEQMEKLDVEVSD